MKKRQGIVLALLFCAALPCSAQTFDRPLIFGINPIWAIWLDKEPQEFDPLMFDAVKAAGATCVRIGLGWAGVERERGVYNWEQWDSWIGLAAERDLEVVLLMCVPPMWASHAKHENEIHKYPPAPEFMEDYERFWRMMVSRYKHHVKRWELNNEPNHLGWHTTGYADDYVPQLKSAYNILKEVDPEARLSIGGLDGCDVRYVQQIYDLGGGDYFDAVAVHPYTSEGIDAAGLIQLHQLLGDHGHGHKPLWITEYGWVVHNEEAQARNIERSFEVLLRDDFSFVELATFHTICDFGPEAGHRYGLMTSNLEPRKAYHTYREIASNPEAFMASRVTIEPPPVHAELLNGNFEGEGIEPWVVLGNTDGIQGGSIHGIEPFEGRQAAGANAAWDLKNGTYLQRIEAVPDRYYRLTARIYTAQRGGGDENCRWRLGIDPTGGADPVALTVIWSELLESPNTWNLHTSPWVKAEGEIITVFLEHRQSWPLDWNQMLIDAVQLEEQP